MNLEKLKSNPKMPKHIAFILDGNGRWAKRRGLPRSLGHKAGFDNLKKQVKFVQELGIKNLSLYCFSQENWNRPKEEVDYLMNIFSDMIDEFRKDYLDKDIRILISGDLDDERVPYETRVKAKKLIEDTKEKTGFVINACINYGGRQEIVRAVNNIIKSGANAINAEDFDNYLYTKDLLPLDFIIRTSGQLRTSNFMPWQSTYSEWYFPKKLWPGFSKRDLVKSLKLYMRRNRRFGAIKE